MGVCWTACTGQSWIGLLAQRLSFAVPTLGYADDFCVLGTPPAHLQRLLDVAYAFLNGVAIQLSVAKTKVLVLCASLGNASVWTARRGTAWAAVPPVAWTCGGLLLERVAEYRYLGVVVSAVAGTGQAAFTRLRGQMFVSWDRLHEQFGNLHNGLSSRCSVPCFNSLCPRPGPMLVRSGVSGTCGAQQSRREQVAQSHVELWRRLLRVWSGVAGAIALQHLGVLSLPQCGYRALYSSGTRSWRPRQVRCTGRLPCWTGQTRPTFGGESWVWSLQRTLRDLCYHLPLDSC